MPWPCQARTRGRNIEDFGDGEQLPKLRAGCSSHPGGTNYFKNLRLGVIFADGVWRSDYGEIRVRALGHLDDDCYLVVYTWRGRQSPDHQRVEGRRRWQEKISSVTRSKNLRLYGRAARHAHVPTPRSARLTRIFGSTLTWSCQARAKLPYTFVCGQRRAGVVSEAGQGTPEPHERRASLIRGGGSREAMNRLRLGCVSCRNLPRSASASA